MATQATTRKAPAVIASTYERAEIMVVSLSTQRIVTFGVRHHTIREGEAASEGCKLHAFREVFCRICAVSFCHLRLPRQRTKQTPQPA